MDSFPFSAKAGHVAQEVGLDCFNCPSRNPMLLSNRTWPK
jgi:hypothetical protein